LVVEPTLRVQPALRQLPARRGNAGLDAGFANSGSSDGGIRCVDQGILDDESGCFAMIQNESNFFGAQHEVDRHQQDAQPRRGKVQHSVLPAVTGQQSKTITFRHAGSMQCSCGPVDDRLEFSECEPGLAVRNG
jgi:hypothetical protein